MHRSGIILLQSIRKGKERSAGWHGITGLAGSIIQPETGPDAVSGRQGALFKCAPPESDGLVPLHPGHGPRTGMPQARPRRPPAAGGVDPARHAAGQGRRHLALRVQFFSSPSGGR